MFHRSKSNLFISSTAGPFSASALRWAHCLRRLSITRFPCSVSIGLTHTGCCKETGLERLEDSALGVADGKTLLGLDTGASLFSGSVTAWSWLTACISAFFPSLADLTRKHRCSYPATFRSDSAKAFSKPLVFSNLTKQNPRWVPGKIPVGRKICEIFPQPRNIWNISFAPNSGYISVMGFSSK